MKKILFPVVFALAFVACKPYEQIAKTNITLSINAEELYENQQNNDPDFIRDQCSLKDDQGAIPKTGAGIPSFESKAWKNMKVKWISNVDGESKKLGYKAAIEQILMKSSIGSNVNFFDKTILAGKSGLVIAKVKNIDIEDDEYRYDILFSVKSKNGPKLFFKIDPILKGKN